MTQTPPFPSRRQTSRLLAASLVAALAAGGSACAAGGPIHVRDIVELTNALKNARGGETILLAPGRYTGLTFKVPPTYSAPVTITSARAASPAVINDFSLRGWNGLTFRNLVMQALDHPELVKNDGSYWAFKFMRCNNITIDRVKVQGSLDGDPKNDVSGINFREGDNFTVTNSEFLQLERAVAVGGAKNVTLIQNDLRELRSDGLNFVGVNNVMIKSNSFRDFFPNQGDHADAIQFWTTHAKFPSTDISITGNAILRGRGQYVQGIFLRDQQGHLPHERVTIADNLIVGTGYNGIRLQGVVDLTLTNNELISFAGENKTFLLIQGGKRITASDNRANSISFGDSVEMRNARNDENKAVKDAGAAAIKAWMGRNPELTAKLPAFRKGA